MAMEQLFPNHRRDAQVTRKNMRGHARDHNHPKEDVRPADNHVKVFVEPF